MKTLGIFIISDRNPDYLKSLAWAARDKGLATHIHFSGSGVRLAAGADFDDLPPASRITICAESAELFEVDRRLRDCCAQWLVPSSRMAQIMRSCDRHIFI